MTTHLKLLFITFLLVVCSFTHATNYYVSTTGSDANIGTLIFKPYRTVQKALSKVAAGDNIYVMSGVYYERLLWMNSGTFLLPITLTNYNGATVVIDGSTGGTNITQNELLLVTNKSNLNITNIEFRNNYRPNAIGVYIKGAGANFNITNCKIYNIGWTINAATVPRSTDNANPFIVVGSSSTSISNLMIKGNIVRDCNTGYSEGLTLTGNVDNFTISNNTIYNITNIGIDIGGHYSWTGAPDNVNKARNGKVQDNIVYNCVSKAAVSAGIYVDGGESIILERNISYNNGVGFSIGCENGGFTVTGIVMRDNIIYGNQSVGLYFGSNQSNSSVSSSTVTNNTFYRNGVKEPWGVEIALQNNANNSIKQNIIVPNNDQAVGIGIWGFRALNPSIKYNLLWRITGNTGNMLEGVTATNSVYGNPNFANVTAGNFHLLSGSKAINAGDPLFIAAGGETDIDKQFRIQAGRVDIGADETALLNFASVEKDTFSFIKGIFSDNLTLTAFPNPTTGMLNLTLPEKTSLIVVTDISGKSMKTISVQDNLTPAINMSDLPDGIYFLNIIGTMQELTHLKIYKRAN